MTNTPAHRTGVDRTGVDRTGVDRIGVDRAAADRGAVDYPPVSRPMESTGLARGDAAALADLQMHWGSRYEIGLDGDIWSATFHGTADQLRARTCLELRTLIRADYSCRQQAAPARGEPGAGGSDEENGEAPWESYGHPPTGGERMSL